jgi:NitT/TauT family transport system substrate-binding protein
MDAAFGSDRRIRWSKVIIVAVVWSLTGLLPLAAAPLKMGILPVIDTLPLQVAVQEGFFAAEGIAVELVMFSSAMERNTAMHSGQLDGFFGDIPAMLLLVRNGVDIRFLTVSYATDPEQRMFGLVLSPSLTKASGELTVAISRASIIEWLLDRLKPDPALAAWSIVEVEIRQMPIRLQMVLTGRIDAALLPEPLLTLAESRGARLAVTDQGLSMPLTVLTIHRSRLADRQAFLTGYGRAVDIINREPERFRELMVKTGGIPPDLATTFPLYRYPLPRIPTEAEVMQVQDWMLDKGLLTQRIPYRRLSP